MLENSYKKHFNYVCFLVVLFECIQFVFTAEFYSEKLEIFPLRSSSFAPKTLWHFNFDFQSDLDIESLISDEIVPPRPVLENMFVYANVTDFKLEIANGKPNPFLLDEGSFYFSLPKEGKKIYTNEEANWGNLIHQLQEIFSLSVQKLPSRNYYKYDSSFQSSTNKTEIRDNFPNYEESFLYGSDPVDYMCNDFIERLQEIVPCKGMKGIMSLLKFPKVFGSDYISSTIGLHLDKEAKKVFFKVEFNVIGNNDFLDHKVKFDKCNRFHSSDIIDYFSLRKGSNSSEKYTLDQDSFTLSRIDYLPPQIFQKDMLKSRRYLTNPRFSFYSDLVHEITNLDSKNTIKVVVYEYLLSHTHPIFHKVDLLLNGKEVPVDKKNFEIEYEKSKYALFRFEFEIPANSILTIRIPFEKLIKQFENYPHDPSRGEDLIPSIILYQVINSNNLKTPNKVFRMVSEDILVELPHTDFSMPFTNIAITMSIIGFLSMSIYRSIFENPKKETENKLTQLKNKLKEKCLRRFKNKDKTD